MYRCLRYLSKKEFKEIDKKDKCIVGITRLAKYDERKHSTYQSVVVFEDKKESIEEILERVKGQVEVIDKYCSIAAELIDKLEAYADQIEDLDDIEQKIVGLKEQSEQIHADISIDLPKEPSELRELVLRLDSKTTDMINQYVELVSLLVELLKSFDDYDLDDYDLDEPSIPKERKVYLVKPRYFGTTTKYMDVGYGDYIRVKKFPWLLLLLFLSITGVCVYAGSNYIKDKIKDNTVGDIPIVGDVIEDYVKKQRAQQYIDIPGLRQKYDINLENPSIYLINPDGNTVYFRYILTNNDTGEEILATDYIAPNKMIKADMYEILDAGTYNIHVQIATIDIKTHKECSGATLDTQLIVEK